MIESPTLFRFPFHAMAAEHELQLFATSAPIAARAADRMVAR
jgi:hypothetical protein